MIVVLQLPLLRFLVICNVLLSNMSNAMCIMFIYLGFGLLLLKDCVFCFSVN